MAAIAFGAAQNWDQDDDYKLCKSIAGVVVSKVGTATASIEEIEQYESNL